MNPDFPITVLDRFTELTGECRKDSELIRNLATTREVEGDDWINHMGIEGPKGKFRCAILPINVIRLGVL